MLIQLDHRESLTISGLRRKLKSSTKNYTLVLVNIGILAMLFTIVLFVISIPL